MKELDFGKTRVSQYVSVQENSPEKGRHKVFIILLAHLEDGSDRCYKIGLTATDGNLKAKIASIAKNIVSGQILKQLKEFHNLDDDQIDGITFVDKRKTIPYKEKEIHQNKPKVSD